MSKIQSIVVLVLFAEQTHAYMPIAKPVILKKLLIPKDNELEVEKEWQLLLVKSDCDEIFSWTGVSNDSCPTPDGSVQIVIYH